MTGKDAPTEFLMRDIPRGVASRPLKQQRAPQTRWQAPEAVAESALLAYRPDDPGGKVLLGALGAKLIGIEDNRHILTVAGSRAGKSVTVVGNLLFYRGSVLATDPKGELATLTAARRGALGQKVHVLDPFRRCRGAAAERRARYNPLAGLRADGATLIEDAGLIAEAIVVPSPGAKDPHWDESARNLVEGLILHVATAPEHDGARTLVTVRRLLSAALRRDEPFDPAFQAPFALEEAMLANAAALSGNEATAAAGNAIEGAARDFFDKAEEERSGVLSNARRHTRFLDYAAMRDVLGGHDFDLADLKRDPGGVTVYLVLPAGRLGLCNRWLRLFVSQLTDEVEREETAPKAPVLAILDEFPVLGYMRQLEDAIGQIASFGVRFWVIIQDWSQGEALYGKRWESFAANAGVMQFFGNNDLATTEYVSKKLGTTRVDVLQAGEVVAEQRAAGLSGLTERAELHSLLTPDEVARYFARSDVHKRQLVLWAGYLPMVLQRVEYFDRAAPYAVPFQAALARQPEPPSTP